jgi:hypothetical protein
MAMALAVLAARRCRLLRPPSPGPWCRRLRCRLPPCSSVGVLDWFDANREVSPTDGTYNEINTRVELKAYDPGGLAALIGEYPPEDSWRPACPGAAGLWGAESELARLRDEPHASEPERSGPTAPAPPSRVKLPERPV